MSDVSFDTTKELIIRAHEGDKQSKEKLVLDNSGLVWSIANRFLGRGAEQEDLFQIGCIGLIKAIDNFDLGYDVKFSTYAVPMITGEIKRFLRDDGIIKVSRTIKENAYKCVKAQESLKLKLNREPTIEEISEETGLDVCDIAMTIGASEHVESIYKTVYVNDESEVCLIDRIEDKVDHHEKAVDNMVVNELMEELTDREKKLIKMRYYDECTQSQVAEALGISQVQVSRLEKKILKNMREHLVE